MNGRIGWTGGKIWCTGNISIVGASRNIQRRGALSQSLGMSDVIVTNDLNRYKQSRDEDGNERRNRGNICKTRFPFTATCRLLHLLGCE